jgi:hypothetical protein
MERPLRGAVLFWGELGNKERIAICLDNAPWHNLLTKESIVPKHTSSKQIIQEWLKDHDIEFPVGVVLYFYFTIYL